MANVTVDNFELLPAAPAADRPAAAAASGAPIPPPSRHDLLRALRLELSRLARVRAH